MGEDGLVDTCRVAGGLVAAQSATRPKANAALMMNRRIVAIAIRQGCKCRASPRIAGAIIHAGVGLISARRCPRPARKAKCCGG
jgi:hypothetical protein